MREQKSRNNEHHEDGHYWISISDLMTLLLFIFILILAYTIYTFSEKSEKFNESFENRSELLFELQKDLKKDNIIVDIDPKKGNMRIKSDGLFGVGSADLSPQGKFTLSKIARTIKVKMHEPKFHNAIETIFIEGHTDNVPISGGENGRRWTNMELSAQRAINTFLVMDQDANINEMTNRDGHYLFSYSGYADQRPRADNDTEAGRAKNRRIEIFFALTSPQLTDRN